VLVGTGIRSYVAGDNGERHEGRRCAGNRREVIRDMSKSEINARSYNAMMEQCHVMMRLSPQRRYTLYDWRAARCHVVVAGTYERTGAGEKMMATPDAGQR